METCFLASYFHNNKVFLTLGWCSLTLVDFILTLENLGPRVNDSWDSDPSENPERATRCLHAQYESSSPYGLGQEDFQKFPSLSLCEIQEPTT